MKHLLINAAVSGVATLAFSVIFGIILLPILRKKKIGQYINEYVLDHKSKAGTPTMGGLSFVLAFLLTMAGMMIYWTANDINTPLLPVALITLYAVGNAAIGFVDDWFKLNKRQNEGLTEIQKLILQFTVAAAFIAMMAITGNLTTDLRIPFTDARFELSWFAYPLYLLVLVGFVNSTNITDGLDGLASSVAATVAAFILLYAARTLNSEFFLFDPAINTAIGVLGAALLGCVLGFLVFNHYPAKMFMGDTGSLFLGAVIMGCAVLSGELLLFVLAGFLFVIEMLTSLMQRLYYKLTHGKRIFRMAPLHHHFQKLDKPWHEVKIVAVFTVVSILLCALAYFGI